MFINKTVELFAVDFLTFANVVNKINNDTVVLYQILDFKTCIYLM